MTKKSLSDISIWKALSILALPIVISNLLQLAYNFIDAFWVWRLWDGAIATTTMSTTIIFLTVSIWSGFAVAGSILISQYFWANNKKMVSHIAAQSLLMIFITSIILWGLWYIFTPQIVEFIKVDPEIISDVQTFLRISFIALLFNFLFFMFNSIMRWISKPNIPTYIVLFTVVLNFFLDPVLIFWYFWVPAFGVSWAAIATLITQGIACIIGLWLLYSWKLWIHIKLKDYLPDFKVIKQTFLLGLPASIEMSARSWAFAVLMILVNAFWKEILAGYGLAGNFIQIAIMLSMSISMATSILIGQSLWANNFEKAKDVYKISLKYSVFILTVLWIITASLWEVILWVFAPWSDLVINVWHIVLQIWVLSYPFIAIMMTSNWVLRAMWKTRIPMYGVIAWQWFLKIPLAYFLSKTTMWESWIWWADIFPSIIISVLMLVYIMKLDWSKTNLTKKNAHNNELLEEVEAMEWIKEI